MRRKLLIVIVYNEPTVQTSEGRKYISESGVLQVGSNKMVTSSGEQVVIDMSEAGVVEAMEDIKGALIALGYKSVVFNVDSNIHRLINFLQEVQPDLVLNLCESHGGEAIGEMYVASLFEVIGVQYTGSPPLTLGIALNKARAKEILSYNGIPTPRFQFYRASARIAVDGSMEFPMIVKPSREDASVGIDNESVVVNPTELRRRIRYVIEEYDQPALVEEYIPGRELNVAIIGNSKPIVLPVSEIDFSTVPESMHHIVTYEAKWIRGTAIYEATRGICPAPLSPALEAEVKDLALQAYQVLGCRDYARMDIRLTKDNKLYLLDVNPNPDLSDDAGFARSARRYGFTFAEMVGKIVELAIERTP